MKLALPSRPSSNAWRLIIKSNLSPPLPEPGLVTTCSGELRAGNLLSQQESIKASAPVRTPLSNPALQVASALRS